MNPLKTMAKKNPKRTIRFVNLGKEAPNGKPGGTPFGDFDPNTGVIRVDPRQKEDELFDTLVHELIHAAYPFLIEDSVHKGATSISSVLWDLGYRRTHK